MERKTVGFRGWAVPAGTVATSLLACSAQGGGGSVVYEEDGGGSAKDAGAVFDTGTPVTPPIDRDIPAASDVPVVTDRPRPPVDACGAISLGSALGARVATGSTGGRTSMLDTATCGVPRDGTRGGTPAGEAVYAWTAPRSGVYTFDTLGSDYDTLLYARSECQAPDLACNDDVNQSQTLQSSLQLSLDAGQTVLIIIDGFAASAGNYTLNIGMGGGGCVPNCTGRQCGTNGCGGTCGDCAGGQTCNTAGRCIDTRPEADRACPVGGTLRVQLVQVTATPNDPSGEAWDGFHLCSQTAGLIRIGVREYIAAQFLPRWGSAVAGVLDRLFGEWFQARVADLCRLASNWLSGDYAGPDMFVVGYSSGSRVWQTSDVQDAWVAPPSSAPWTNAVWRLPCQSSSATLGFTLWDEDLAVDDLMENVVGSLRAISRHARSVEDGG